MVFEGTISLGNIVTVLVTIFAAVGFVWSLRGDMTTIREVTKEQIKHISSMLDGIQARFHADDVRETQRFDRLEAEVKGIASKLGDLLRQDERINFLEQRLQDLHRGDRDEYRPRRKTPKA